MKFGKFFEFGVHEEWREFYVPYERLRSLLREAAARVGPPKGGGGGASAAATPARPGRRGMRAPLLDPSRSPAPSASSRGPQRAEERARFAEEFFGALARTERFYRSRERELFRMYEELLEHTLELAPPPRGGGTTQRQQGQQPAGSPARVHPSKRPAAQGVEAVRRRAGKGGEAGEGGQPQGPPRSASGTPAPAGKSFWSRTTDKRRLRKNWHVLYKMVANLKSFGQLNYTAARKIAKKWDKSVRTRRRLTAEFVERSVEYTFWTSPALDELMTRVEEAYAEHFKGGDVKTALVDLQRVRTKVPLFDMLYLGFNVGMVAAVIFAFVVITQVNGDSSVDMDEVVDILPVFRAAVCFTLFAWCWGLLVRTWTAYNINHAYMFDFNPQTTLSFVEILKLASVLTAILAVSTFLYYSALLTGSDSLFGVESKWYVVAVLVIFAAFLLNPFDFFHRSTRQTLYRNIFQVITAPFWKVRFVGVYVGDVITSMVHPITDLEYTFCYYSSSTPHTCRKVHNYVLPVVAALPYIWRAMQCLRRYRDTGDKWNLANAGKYLSGIIVTVLGTLYADFVSDEGWDGGRVAWMMFFVIEVMYMYTWDILMDWGFRPLSSRNFLLRDTLVYNRRWLYYFAIVSNFFARWVWALTITPFRFTKSHANHELITLALSVCEILRRFQWSFLRVENEYLANNARLRSIATVVPPGAHYHGGKLLHATPAHIQATGGAEAEPLASSDRATAAADAAARARHARSSSVSAAWSPVPARPAPSRRAASLAAATPLLLDSPDLLEGDEHDDEHEHEEEDDGEFTEHEDADSDDEIHESPMPEPALRRAWSGGSAADGPHSPAAGAWVQRGAPRSVPAPTPAQVDVAGTHSPTYFYSAALSEASLSPTAPPAEEPRHPRAP